MAFYWRKFSGTGASSGGAGYSAGSTLNTATLQAVAEEQEGAAAESLRNLQQHWVQQTVMGVLRWRESSSNSTSSSNQATTNTATMTRNNSSSGGGGVPMNRHSIEVCF